MVRAIDVAATAGVTVVVKGRRRIRDLSSSCVPIMAGGTIPRPSLNGVLPRQPLHPRVTIGQVQNFLRSR